MLIYYFMHEITAVKKFLWDKYLGGVEKWNNHSKSNLDPFVAEYKASLCVTVFKKIQAV